MLGLLFVGRFDFVGFPVKCAEAGWLLEVSFHGIFTYSSYLGIHILIFAYSESIMWQAAPGASFLAPSELFLQIEPDC